MARVCEFTSTDAYGQDSVLGPPSQTMFLGCTIQKFNVALGWNEQSTTLNINLVEDKCAIPEDEAPKLFHNLPGHTGETRDPDPGFDAYRPTIGGPVYFRFGKFEYLGVVQSWTKNDSPEGLDMYTVVVTDPRFILGNMQVICTGYRGGVFDQWNVINPYGWLDGGQYGDTFGCSDVNEVGVPWNYIRNVTQSMLTNSIVKSIYSPYNMVMYRTHNWDELDISQSEMGLVRTNEDVKDARLAGFQNQSGWVTGYFVDLEEVPLGPHYYRLNQNNISLLDLVDQVCQDSGHDYWIETFYLKGNSGDKVIKVRTQKRVESRMSDCILI
mgnify:CR=1 FL=1